MVGAELRPLGAVTDLAHELAGSLTPVQRVVAVIGEVRGALRVGPGPIWTTSSRRPLACPEAGSL